MRKKFETQAEIFADTYFNTPVKGRPALLKTVTKVGLATYTMDLLRDLSSARGLCNNFVKGHKKQDMALKLHVTQLNMNLHRERMKLLEAVHSLAREEGCGTTLESLQQRLTKLVWEAVH